MNSPGNAGFGPVLAVRSFLSALTVPYWIAGGRAIDLAVGRVTRDHVEQKFFIPNEPSGSPRSNLLSCSADGTWIPAQHRNEPSLAE